MDSEQLTKELSLKAMTAVSNLITDYQRGLISRAQVASGCRAVFDTVGGLVGSDVFDLVSQAAKEFHAKGVEVDLIKHGDGLAGTIRICGAGKVVRVRGKSHYAADYTSDDPDALAKRASDIYMERLHRG